MIKTINLIRGPSTDDGTFGSLFIDNFHCVTIELPWKNNKRNVSCIPEGEYILTPYTSRKFGQCYAVMDVPGRFGVLIHTGNYAGDKSKGKKAHSSGCILVGYKRAIAGNGQALVTSSRTTMGRLRAYLGHDRNAVFNLKIQGVKND